ncbi:hypothetical protein ACIBXA_17175 [Micromonospora echinaurantiaca]|uniref:hypothetical protein n=1 Tax=Micromonospora echinaurantiaca TaxID=47857 RepID=UPI0037B4EB08
MSRKPTAVSPGRPPSAYPRASITYATIRRPWSAARSVGDSIRSTSRPTAAPTAFFIRSVRWAAEPAGAGGPISTANSGRPLSPAQTTKSTPVRMAVLHWWPVMPGGRRCTRSPIRRSACTTCPARVSTGARPSSVGIARSQEVWSLPVLVIA